MNGHKHEYTTQTVYNNNELSMHAQLCSTLPKHAQEQHNNEI